MICRYSNCKTHKRKMNLNINIAIPYICYMILRALILISLLLFCLFSCYTTPQQIINPADAIDKGIAYLKQSQLDDGSWATYKGSRQYPLLIKESPIFSSLCIIDFLDEHHANAPWLEKTYHYIENQFNPDYTLNFDGKEHLYCCGKILATGKWLPPDFDDTSLGLLLLKDKLNLNENSKDSLLKLYKKHELGNQLFPSFMIGYYPKKIEMPLTMEAEAKTSLGVNVNTLRYKTAYNLQPDIMCAGIGEWINTHQLTDDPYYPPYMLAYWLLQTETCNMVKQHFFSQYKPTIESASTLAIDVLILIEKGNEKEIIRPFIDKILNLQNEDGSWDAEPQFYGGGIDDPIEQKKRYYSFFEQYANQSFQSSPYLQMYPEIGKATECLTIKQQGKTLEPPCDELAEKYYHYFSILINYHTRHYYYSDAATTALCLKALSAYNSLE